MKAIVYGVMMLSAALSGCAENSSDGRNKTVSERQNQFDARAGDDSQVAATNPSANNAALAATTISFIYLNDLHAHLTSHVDKNVTVGKVSLVKRGGFATLATAIKSIKAENPLNVVINVGDTFHGGVEAAYTEGNAIVPVVNALGIDVGVPGNWDFAYGPPVTRSRYTNDRVLLNPGGQTVLKPNFPNLAANVINNGRFVPRSGQSFLPPTMTKVIGGVTVGFIGITSDIVPQMHPSLAFGLKFAQGQQAYVDLIDANALALRSSGAQVVVVMSELGIHKDVALANLIKPKNVDIIFSAHTHELTITPITTASGAKVVEGGNDAHMGRMDVTVSAGAITNLVWQVIDVDETKFTPDPAVLALVDKARAPFLAANVNMKPIGGASLLVRQTLTRPINTVLGKTQLTLDRRNALENNLNNAMTDAMRKVAGTQLAMISGFRFDTITPGQGEVYEDATVATGDITLEDAYRFFPVPYTIAKASTTGAKFSEIVENNLTRVFSPNVFNHWGGWVDGFSGADISVNLAQPDGARVLGITVSGSTAPVGAAEVLTIAGCKRPFEADPTTMCNSSGFSSVTTVKHPVTGLDLTGVDLFTYAVENGLMPGVAHTNIKDANNTPMFPNGEYYQPLYGVK